MEWRRVGRQLSILDLIKQLCDKLNYIYIIGKKYKLVHERWWFNDLYVPFVKRFAAILKEIYNFAMQAFIISD